VQTKTNNRLPALLALIAGVIFIGFTAIFVRTADAPGTVSSFFRIAIAVGITALPFGTHLLKNKPALTRRGVGIAVFAGILFGIDLALWSTGIVISGATTPTLMANTAPLWVGLGAWLIFRERLKGLFWVGLALAFLGATIVLGQELMRDLEFGIGTLFGLGAAVGYGAYQLVTQRGRANMDTLSYFWITGASSALMLLVLNLVLGHPMSGFDSKTILSFIILAAIHIAGWLAINYAQGFLPASIVAPSLLGQPVVTAIAASIFLGEQFSVWHILGGLAVLGGVFLVHYSNRVAA